MAGKYQIKKRLFGGYSVAYQCPHCSTPLTSHIDEAGTTQPCPNCNQPFIVPGKTERDQLRVKQEAERREKEQAKQQKRKESARLLYLRQEEARKRQKQEEDARILQSSATLPQPNATQTKTCPFCAEVISAQAIKCKHCGSMLDPSKERKPGRVYPSDPPKDPMEKFHYYCVCSPCCLQPAG